MNIAAIEWKTRSHELWEVCDAIKAKVCLLAIKLKRWRGSGSVLRNEACPSVMVSWFVVSSSFCGIVPTEAGQLPRGEKMVGYLSFASSGHGGSGRNHEFTPLEEQVSRTEDPEIPSHAWRILVQCLNTFRRHHQMIRSGQG